MRPNARQKDASVTKLVSDATVVATKIAAVNNWLQLIILTVQNHYESHFHFYVQWEQMVLTETSVVCLSVTFTFRLHAWVHENITNWVEASQALL